MDKLRFEEINHFGIYIDLDCNPDIYSTLNRWETLIRLAKEDGKRYIEMTMIKFASQLWRNLKP